MQGQRSRQVNKTVKVNVPPGIDTGTRLKMRGEGAQAPSDTAAGDLYVVLKVKRTPPFRAGRKRCLCPEGSKLSHALSGRGDQGPHPRRGDPAQDSLGYIPGVFRLKGLGVPKTNGYGRGDQFVHLHITVPKTMTERQKELHAELSKEFQGLAESEAPASGFKQKFKDFFDMKAKD